MSEPKPFAALSSGLLARKGTAKPAMRPQGFGQAGAGIEDLGWNDMGYAPPVAAEGPQAFQQPNHEHVPSSISALTPAPRSQGKNMSEEPSEDYLDEPFAQADEELTEVPVSELASPVEVPVREQQRAIAASFPAEEGLDHESDEPENAAQSAPVIAMPRRPRQAPGLKGKAAFTLRLDPDRHLKLRLACAVTHRSAQQIVSDALDQYLKTVPELDAMARQLPARAGKRN